MDADEAYRKKAWRELHKNATNCIEEILKAKECPCGVMFKVMDCRIIISEFELQLRYYVHFRANTIGKGMNPLILPAMELDSTITNLLEG